MKKIHFASSPYLFMSIWYNNSTKFSFKDGCEGWEESKKSCYS